MSNVPTEEGWWWWKRATTTAEWAPIVVEEIDDRLYAAGFGWREGRPVREIGGEWGPPCRYDDADRLARAGALLGRMVDELRYSDQYVSCYREIARDAAAFLAARDAANNEKE
jgi:hypothetical protein